MVIIIATGGSRLLPDTNRGARFGGRPFRQDKPFPISAIVRRRVGCGDQQVRSEKDVTQEKAL